MLWTVHGLALADVLDCPPPVLDQVVAGIWKAHEAREAQAQAQDARAGAMMHRIVDGLHAS
ncbi:hypothetical protein K6U06_06620 [Acidiferrimicrobium sp. IK]|uniref:hypothetical protein n=1 Tax=Acidiferrimicrobium sp. IK TaxID=2871700 RepID=UPI0021CB1226|nr:hypothetical protein [Acidiferrimicrobium sp. IK]MCU4184027.1 hypothetical protein [Acidiferrimicrobium sp. IK]